tara:strand:+ start:615 stop:1637 length:1023 start_codon:yes stop_codon:yes gene_type:complete
VKIENIKKFLYPSKHKYLPSVIIGGYERGGTTLLSDWLRSSDYFSYFEIGVLLHEDPISFEKDDIYFKNFKTELENKGLNLDISFKSFESFYRSIFFDSQNKRSLFFDKTPKYMENLGNVIERAKFCDKFLIISRDPRCVFYSWSKRQKRKSETITECLHRNLKTYSERYLEYYLSSISFIEDERVLFIKYEDLCLDHICIKQKIERFLSIDIETTQIFERETYYDNVKSGFDYNKPFEALEDLSDDFQIQILQKTKQAAIFFHNDKYKPQFIDGWSKDYIKAKKLIKKFDLKEHSMKLDNGFYFDPIGYYLRYPDILGKNVDAFKHFELHGIKEGRIRR